jgi:hypothetical protein
LLLALVIGACAPAPKEAVTPSDAGAGTFRSADEAEAHFDGAEQELIALVIGDAAGVDGESHPPPTYQHEPAPTPLPQPGTVQLQSKKDRCTRACKALASMQRAADQLCELDGESSPRCKSVRARVRSARHLVRSTCPTCSA